jgi:hypothetical protein
VGKLLLAVFDAAEQLWNVRCRQRFMRTWFIIIFALLLVGCAKSPLTPMQAEALAVRLANDKADALFHHWPFLGSQPADFSAGHWVWADRLEAGLGEYKATVELATDGSTNSVDVRYEVEISFPIQKPPDVPKLRQPPVRELPEKP